jgi:sulfopyruvate decarboxylase TPP-binding subunit
MLGNLTHPTWRTTVKMKYITLILINEINALTSLPSVVRITLQQIQHKGQFKTGITAHFFSDEKFKFTSYTEIINIKTLIINIPSSTDILMTTAQL